MAINIERIHRETTNKCIDLDNIVIDISKKISSGSLSNNENTVKLLGIVMCISNNLSCLNTASVRKDYDEITRMELFRCLDNFSTSYILTILSKLKDNDEISFNEVCSIENINNTLIKTMLIYFKLKGIHNIEEYSSLKELLIANNLEEVE